MTERCSEGRIQNHSFRILGVGARYGAGSAGAAQGEEALPRCAGTNF